MTEPDEALIWARERAKRRVSFWPPNPQQAIALRVEIDAGKHDAELSDEARAYRAGQAASAERIKALEGAIDAARLEGIRLGLEAAAREAESCAAVCTEEGMPETAIVLAQHSNEIAALDPTTIAREAVLDKLASEAQEQGMGYEKEADQ
jgi:hypothetical protein